MRRFVRIAAVAVLALPFANRARAEAGVGELLPLIPESANAVVVVQARQLLDSPRGQQENWRAKQEANFLAGSVGVPPSVDVIVRGAHITPSQPTGTWSVGLIHRPPGLNIQTLQQHEQGQQETIDGKPVVISRRGYFAEVAPGVLGVMSADASRQDFARWLRADAKATAPRLSTYLLSAVADSSAQVLLAIDLQDMPNPLLLRERLASSPALKGRAADQAALLKLLMSVQGCRLAIRVTDATTASLTFDFAEDVVPQAVFLKPVVIELLEDLGAVLDELRDAQVASSGKSVALKFTLTDQGLRRIMSLVPMPLVNRPTASGGTPGSAATADLAASRNYYRQVSRLLTDLQRLNRSAREYQKTALWHDNYARRIAELPVVGVDPELLDYGADVVQKLRLLAASLRGTTIDLAAIQTKAKYQVNVSPFYGPAGSFQGTAGYVPAPWEVSTNLAEVRSQQAEAAARGASQREQIWQLLESETIRIRNRMAEKYSADFNRSAK